MPLNALFYSQAPTSFTITNMRSQVVDFALPIVEMHHRFFIKNPEDGFNWTAYFDPLAWEVWVRTVKRLKSDPYAAFTRPFKDKFMIATL